MMGDSPYEEDLQPIQGELGNIVDKGPELKTLEELEEAGLVGITWNEWLECVQWLSIRYTTGDSSPANWDDAELQAGYQDLQDWSYKDIQSAIVKLHQEGRSFAPNPSQIIGMLNRLGAEVVISQRKLKASKSGSLTECVGGGDHEWFELGWLHNEYGDPVFIEACGKSPSVQAKACNAEREVPAPDHQMYAKPEPMWLEKFVETAQRMGLPEHRIDWMLSNARPNLRNYAQHIKKYGHPEEKAVEGTIE